MVPPITQISASLAIGQRRVSVLSMRAGWSGKSHPPRTTVHSRFARIQNAPLHGIICTGGQWRGLGCPPSHRTSWREPRGTAEARRKDRDNVDLLVVRRPEK